MNSQNTQNPQTPSYTQRFQNVMMRSAIAPMAILDHGQGATVWDIDGREYLDFLAGIAVNALGHAHPVVVDAVSSQAAKVAHISGYYASVPQIELAERLVRLTGGDRVFFANSGTEAIEAAVKLARLTGKPRILSLENSFHGRSMGALSLTGKPAMQDPFRPLVPGIEQIPTDLGALEAALAVGDVAALVVEPIKGEAGVIDLPAGWLAEARRLTSEAGALLILDEIQTGAGRTGAWFAFQEEGIVPDAIALAKGIGGGFPIGALVTFGAASDLFRSGHHGSTFGGNPLATATANAVLAEIERAGLVENARVRGAQLRAAIEGMRSSLVGSVSGRGLLIGVVLTAPVAKQLVQSALGHGLIINATTDGRIRIAPPLIIGDAEVAAFAERFWAALADVATALPALETSGASA